jgi:hypothetical protein
VPVQRAEPGEPVGLGTEGVGELEAVPAGRAPVGMPPAHALVELTGLLPERDPAEQVADPFADGSRWTTSWFKFFSIYNHGGWYIHRKQDSPREGPLP